MLYATADSCSALCAADVHAYRCVLDSSTSVWRQLLLPQARCLHNRQVWQHCARMCGNASHNANLGAASYDIRSRHQQQTGAGSARVRCASSSQSAFAAHSCALPMRSRPALLSWTHFNTHETPETVSLRSCGYRLALQVSICAYASHLELSCACVPA